MAAVFGDIHSIPGFSEPISCWTHLLGAAAMLALAPFMLRHVAKTQRMAVAVFVSSAVVLLSMSGVFHLLEPGGSPRAVFLRLDHAAIWLLISGTISAMLMIGYHGWQCWGGLSLLWTATITALVLKTVFFDGFPEWLSLLLYLALGWVGLVGAWGLARRLGTRSQRWLFRGGVVYSSGALLDFACYPTIVPNIIGPHELFHLFVLVGIACHWRYLLGLTRCVELPPALVAPSSQLWG